MISVSDRVTISDKPLHGNIAIMSDGQVLAIEGSSVKVMIDGEESPRHFQLAQVKSSSDVYGYENPGPNSSQVINGMRRN